MPENLSDLAGLMMDDIIRTGTTYCRYQMQSKSTS